jgi:hypothetical protein
MQATSIFALSAGLFAVFAGAAYAGCETVITAYGLLILSIYTQ